MSAGGEATQISRVKIFLAREFCWKWYILTLSLASKSLCGQTLIILARPSVSLTVSKQMRQLTALQLTGVWLRSVLRLTKYVPLSKVVKLRACRLASKVDPQVILGAPVVVAVAVAPEPPATNCDNLLVFFEATEEDGALLRE